MPAFTFEARPVIPVAAAVRVQLEAMAYRDGLNGKHHEHSHTHEAVTHSHPHDHDEHHHHSHEK